MKPHNSYHAHITGVIKDSLIIALLFISLSFIDVSVAAFVCIITTVILLTRRIILEYNPGFIKGHHIIYNERELIVPKGVDVFDLSNVPSMEYLYKYIEVIRGILVPPGVLIIRLRGITKIDEYDLEILNEVILRLQKSKIIVILSDVEENVQEQFSNYGIEKIIGKENIFLVITEALPRAEKLIKMNKRQKNNKLVL